MAKDINLQDVFLNQARKDRIPVKMCIRDRCKGEQLWTQYRQ